MYIHVALKKNRLSTKLLSLNHGQAFPSVSMHKRGEPTVDGGLESDN